MESTDPSKRIGSAKGRVCYFTVTVSRPKKASLVEAGEVPGDPRALQAERTTSEMTACL